MIDSAVQPPRIAASRHLTTKDTTVPCLSIVRSRGRIEFGRNRCDATCRNAANYRVFASAEFFDRTGLLRYYYRDAA